MNFWKNENALLIWILNEIHERPGLIDQADRTKTNQESVEFAIFIGRIWSQIDRNRFLKSF